MLRTIQRGCVERNEITAWARDSGAAGKDQTGAARDALASGIAGVFDVLTGAAGCCGHMFLLE
jgi:hypothetical protein